MNYFIFLLGLRSLVFGFECNETQNLENSQNTNFNNYESQNLVYLCQPKFEECPQCPNIYEPVCAMELQDRQLANFLNPCEVNRNACLTNKSYDIIYHGQCSHQIDTYLICPTFCTLEYEPICARFNNELREFSNGCEYQKTMCESNIRWQIIKLGSCFDDQTSICNKAKIFSKIPNYSGLQSISAKEFENNCTLEKTTSETDMNWSIVHKTCPKFCTKDYNPVCARYSSAVREFPNDCEFQRSRCETKIDWQFLHFGTCSVGESNTGNNWDLEAVCASNGRINETYSNCFQLQQEVQRTGIEWSIIHMGVCRVASNSTTTAYLTTNTTEYTTSATKTSTESTVNADSTTQYNHTTAPTISNISHGQESSQKGSEEYSQQSSQENSKETLNTVNGSSKNNDILNKLLNYVESNNNEESTNNYVTNTDTRPDFVNKPGNFASHIQGTTSDPYNDPNTASKLSYPYFGNSNDFYQSHNSSITNTGDIHNGAVYESPVCNAPTHNYLDTSAVFSEFSSNNQFSSPSSNQLNNYLQIILNQHVKKNYREYSHLLHNEDFPTPKTALFNTLTQYSNLAENQYNPFQISDQSSSQYPSYCATQYYTPSTSNSRTQYNAFEYLTALSSVRNKYRAKPLPISTSYPNNFEFALDTLPTLQYNPIQPNLPSMIPSNNLYIYNSITSHPNQISSR